MKDAGGHDNNNHSSRVDEHLDFDRREQAAEFQKFKQNRAYENALSDHLEKMERRTTEAIRDRHL
jgi:hypothetical protein